MASGSPRNRINQFFASRKRKPESPSFKSEKINHKDAKIALDVSPSAKGTLDSYLKNSQDDNNNGGDRVRQGRIKRNLGLEINSSELASKHDVSSAKDCSLEGDDVAGQDTVLGGNNSDLKRFANDFLSLYCSNLQSSAIGLSENGRKRSGSPTLLDEKGEKKQCISGVIGKPVEAVSCHPGELDGIDRNESCARHASLRKCNSLGHIDCSTPGLLINKTAPRETPRSGRGSSIFSPGEEFWNEAIQVADGLYVPADTSSVHIVKGITSLTSQCEQKISCNIETNRFGDRLNALAEADCITSVSDSKAPLELVKTHNKEVIDFQQFMDKEVSPLPVRHFDFLHEGRNLHGKTPYQCSSDNKETGAYKSSRQYDKEPLRYKGSLATTNILSRCSNAEKMRRSTSDDKAESAVLITSKAEFVVPSLSSSKEIHQAQDSFSHPLASEIKVDLPVQKNEIDTSSMLEKANRSPSATLNNHDEACTPSSFLSSNDYLELKHWLPSEVCSIYMNKGISKLYPWQVDCLKVEGVLQKRNLVYCASTSAGKSFVAEILMLRRVISTGKIAILVLPYVSICAEKAEHLEVLLQPLGKHVRSFYGNQGGGTLPKDTSVAVCTIEKANFLVNKLLEEGRLSEVGIIVIDELHMVGDQSRGYLLELMLTKLRYASGEGNLESSSEESSGSSSGKTDPANGLQIVGMSATMPNVAAVADWLQAALYQTEFRPVPLEEFIKVGNSIYDKKMDLVRTLPRSSDLGGKDPDHIVALCNEVVQDGHSVLIFCSSRKGCESTAKHVAKFIKQLPVGNHDDRSEFSDIYSAIDALRRCPVGLDPVLEETLPSGVAYHHAGLTVEEREIVETCYRKGLLRVLTATSTLAAGVNLPARRVIFRQPKIGRDFLDGTRYKQMAGRAGRTGIDTKGESILLCKQEELKRITALLNDSCLPLQSCLSEDKNGMIHAILEVVAGGIVQTAGDIHRYVRCTLLNSTKPFEDVVKSAQDSLRWLCHRKFVEWNEETKMYSATPLGRASFGSSLSPEESLIVLEDLSRAREGFVLASDLHLVYLVTPINVEVEPDWEMYYGKFMELSTLDQSVGNRVGVVEPFLMRMAHGAPLRMPYKSRENKKGLHGNPQNQAHGNNNSVSSDEHTHRVCKRFYVALILSRLVQESPVNDVCEAFKVARGMVQALQENAGRFASMVSLFCERLGWSDLEGLVGKFQNRVSFGVRAEIVELTNIPYVKGSRARALYKSGLRTPLAIAEASIPEIAKALFESSSSSSWAAQEGTAQRRIQLGLAKKIKNGARKIVLDKAEEARLVAFTAFQSLGLDVPQFSRPLVSIVSEDPISHGVGASTGKDCLVGAESKKDVSAKPNTERNENPKYPVARLEVENRSNLQENCVDTSRADNLDVKVTNDNQVALNPLESRGIPLPTQLGTDEKGVALSGSLDNVQQDRNGRAVTSQNGTANVYEQGPISVSSMIGGFDCFLELWDRIEEFYFDIHFTKRSELNSSVPFEIHGMSICWEASPVYYVNLSKDLFSSGKRKTEIKDESFNSTCDPSPSKGLTADQRWERAKHRWNRIARIMERREIRKISWNLKVQVQVLKNPGISIQRFGGLSSSQKSMDIELIDGSYFLLPPVQVLDGIDMCIVAWLLWPDEERSSNPNLEKEVKKRLSSEAAASAHRSGRWRNQMRRAAHNGSCRRVAQVRALGSVLWKLLVSEELVNSLSRTEIPLINVLADMEIWGIGVDMEGCLRARSILGKKIKELEKEAYKLAGMTFSLYTSADIANVLFRHLNLPIPEGHTKGKNHPSTDKQVLDLMRHQHPIVNIIKEHRTLAKLLNCTLGSICSLSRLSMRSQRYTLHGHWLQTSTATGRLSMEEPNLQCVEHSVDFKMNITTCDDAKANSHIVNARDFFIPTQENWLLLTADYSQIELRLMAHFAKDSSLIELLSKPTGDVFNMIASRWKTGNIESSVTPQEREQTKRLVYGILYGMGPNTLAEQLQCNSSEASAKIQSFKGSFPGVASWLHTAVSSCREKGYIETLMGRRRYLSKIKFGNSKEKGKAQRQAVNSICQGSAADIIKVAMINIHEVIVEGCEKFDDIGGKRFSVLKGHCRLLLQVHDELVMEVDPCYVREAGLLLQLIMESAVKLLVPLHAKLKVGKTWGSLEPFVAGDYMEAGPC
ncbi:DNA-directed DNA polymerase [Ranunculus cassubicifolius]